MVAGDNRCGFPSARRLKTPAEYAAVQQAPREQSIRAARGLLSISASWHEAGVTSAAVRFGVTVGKRNARRAVDRALIKRIVREACRQQANAFEQCVPQAGVRVDIAMRLKSPLLGAGGQPLAMAQWRRQVRAEADALLEHVLKELPARALHANQNERPLMSSGC